MHPSGFTLRYRHRTILAQLCSSRPEGYPPIIQDEVRARFDELLPEPLEDVLEAREQRDALPNNDEAEDGRMSVS